MARNKAARYLPEALQGGYVSEAADMAQVPPPNPARGQVPRDPASLPESTQTEVQTLINSGVPPELIATYLNHMAAQQGAL
jgi:hypothetical protein